MLELNFQINKEGIKSLGGQEIVAPFVYSCCVCGINSSPLSVGYKGVFKQELDSVNNIPIANSAIKRPSGPTGFNSFVFNKDFEGVVFLSEDKKVHTISDIVLAEGIKAGLAEKLVCNVSDITLLV